jgi:hypothetical protein
VNRQRLTVFTKALDSAANLERVLPGYRDVADEVVVGIDSATCDDSWEVARKYADRVFSFPHGCAFGGGELPRSVFFEHLFPHCTGDWILQLDHDETLAQSGARKGFSTIYCTTVQLPMHSFPGDGPYPVERNTLVRAIGHRTFRCGCSGMCLRSSKFTRICTDAI